VNGTQLHLEHPNPAVRTSVPLVVPDRVDSISGTWNSGEDAEVHLTSTEAGIEVTLE
jgi:hypothetical protein